MAGLIAGAMYGLGGGLVNVAGKLLDAQIEETKQTRLLELQAQYRRADTQQQHELGVARDTARYDLENQDRRAITKELDAYSKPREETLPPDQQGPVGTVTPGETDIARRGGLIASRIGRPDIAGQYKALGEPGKLETLAAEEAAQERRDERQAAAAKALKQTPSGESASERELRSAQADRQREESRYLRGARTEQAMANADKARRGGTPSAAKIVKMDDGTLFDANSGAVGEMVPGQPAKKGATRIFGANDPDTPATAATVRWSLNGRVLERGLDEVYGARGRESAAPATDRRGESDDIPPAAVRNLLADPSEKNIAEFEYEFTRRNPIAKPGVARRVLERAKKQANGDESFADVQKETLRGAPAKKRFQPLTDAVERKARELRRGSLFDPDE